MVGQHGAQNELVDCRRGETSKDQQETRGAGAELHRATAGKNRNDQAFVARSTSEYLRSIVDNCETGALTGAAVTGKRQ